MSRLMDRILGLQAPQPSDNGGVPTLPKDGKDYRAVREIPLTSIVVNGLGTITYDDDALLTADGALIPATGPKTWGQLYAAGRH